MSGIGRLNIFLTVVIGYKQEQPALVNQYIQEFIKQ